MLWKISITLNTVVVFVSTCLFGYTFFAKAHLTQHASDFVSEKTLDYSKPLVELIEAGLEAPITSKLIPAKKRKVMEDELSAYNADPMKYIFSLTKGLGAEVIEEKPGKITQFKQKIRNYYESTLRELIIDLRIFTGSNVVAGLFALFLLFNERVGKMPEVQIFSALIFASVVLSTYGYVQGTTFFSILFKSHLGLFYPIGILATAIYLYKEYCGYFVKNEEKKSEQ